MTRRFQFSLRALLGAAVVVCLLLGGWHLLWTYGQYVEAEPAKLGRSFSVKGRILRPAGPQELAYHFRIERPDGVCLLNLFGEGYIARKGWLGTYRIDTTVELYESDIGPGEYRLSLYTLQRHIATCRLNVEAL